MPAANNPSTFLFRFLRDRAARNDGPELVALVTMAA
jgi:hypothetical protein